MSLDFIERLALSLDQIHDIRLRSEIEVYGFVRNAPITESDLLGLTPDWIQILLGAGNPLLPTSPLEPLVRTSCTPCDKLKIAKLLVDQLQVIETLQEWEQGPRPLEWGDTRTTTLATVGTDGYRHPDAVGDPCVEACVNYGESNNLAALDTLWGLITIQTRGEFEIERSQRLANCLAMQLALRQ